MVDVFLIIILVIVLVLLLVGNFYFVVYWSSDTDRFQAWLPKILVILGLELAECNVLLLPLDVSNRGGGDINMALLWQIVYWAVAAMVVVVLPFGILYYENENFEEKEEDRHWQMCWALIYTFIIAVVVCVIVFVLWTFIGRAEVPVNIATAPLRFADGTDFTHALETASVKKLTMAVSAVVYMVSMLSVAGWILLIMFGGVGLVALPVDEFIDFATRPKLRTPIEIAQEKTRIGRLANRTIEAASAKMKERRELEATGKKLSRKDREWDRRFRAAYYLIENDFKRILLEEKGGTHPIVYVLLLIWGIISSLLTIAWIAHIIVYMLPLRPFWPMINLALDALEKANVAFVAYILYGIFAFYLLLAVIKGNVKFGLRIFLFCPLHPMKKGDTLMNAFLFNTAMILLCSVSVTQFCTQAFASYARMTTIDMLFGVQIKYIFPWSYVWAYLLYALLAMILLSAIYLIFRPRDQQVLFTASDVREQTLEMAVRKQTCWARAR